MSTDRTALAISVDARHYEEAARLAGFRVEIAGSPAGMRPDVLLLGASAAAPAGSLRQGVPTILIRENSDAVCDIPAEVVLTAPVRPELLAAALEALAPNSSKGVETGGQPYGGFVHINTSRRLLDAVGADALREIVADNLGQLETSSAIYKTNGEYALGIFNSGWCRFLDARSRTQCATENNTEALNSGKWVCHEHCWQASKDSIAAGAPVDVECPGGLHLFAAPIMAGDEVVGSINFGYGTPPNDPQQLAEIAAKYGVSVEELKARAAADEHRPPEVVEAAKRRMLTSAKLIGELVERKRIEAALRASEASFRALSDAAPNLVWAADAEGAIVHVNERWCAFTGQTHEEVKGEGWAAAVHPEDLPGVVERWEASVKRGTPHEAECRLRRSDGEYRWFLVRGVPVRDADGRIGHWVGAATDVHDYKELEARLRESEQRLARAQDAALLMTLHVGLDGRWLKLPPRFVEFLGYASAEELLGREFREFTHPDDFEADWSQCLRLLRGEIKSFEIEKRFLRKDGSVTWGYLNCSVVTDAEGRPVHLLTYVRDINAEKRAEAALRQSERRYRQAIYANPIGVITAFIAGPRKGEVTLANNAYLRIIGYSREDLEKGAINWIALTPADDLWRNEEAIRRALATGAPQYWEKQYIRKDGSRVPCYVGFTPVGENNDEAVAFIVDISDRKRLEEQLRERIEELEKVMEVAPVAIWVAHDPECTCITGNRMANELYQAEKDENMSAAATDSRRFLRNGREVSAAELPMQQAAARRIEVRDAEVETVLPDGRRVHLLGHASPLLDSQGRVRGCIGAFLDITERKKSEEALRESEARERARAVELEALMDAVPLAMFISRDPECRHMFGNRAAYELLRVPPGRNLSKTDPLRPELAHFRAMRDGKEIPAGELAMQKAAATGQPVRNCEFDFVFGDGTSRTVLGDAVPMRDENGRVRGVVAAFVDITGRKQAEEQLRQTQKLESIGLLAGGIAHDFNNILTGIMGHASLLADDAGPATAQMVQSIVEQAERAAHLTRQLLAYSGKGQFLIKHLDVSHAVREMLDFLRLSVPKSIEFKLDLRDRLPLIAVDPGQFQQTLMNLVINAGEAIGEGNPGTISVSTEACEVPAPFVDAVGARIDPGRYVCVEVRDTGPGMDEPTRSRVFDPFFTTKFTGRGLGLAAVSGIMRSLKGAVALQTSPGAGAAFRLYFRPVAGAAEQGAPDASASIGTVLVVDDEAAVRDFLATALRRRNYHVLTAADGKDALAVWDAESGRIDLAIVDVVMPVMGGGETIAELKRRRPDLKVLLTSGYSESEAKRLCAGSGVSAFLQKPYTAQTVVEKIAALLGDAGRR